MNEGVYPQHKAYPHDKKLKWYVCERDLPVLYR